MQFYDKCKSLKVKQKQQRPQTYLWRNGHGIRAVLCSV